MSNINVLTTEESIVSNLMRNPDLLGKLKMKPEMFSDNDIRNFIQFVMDKGKVDATEIYYKSREDKNFMSTKRLSDLFNSDGTSKVFFMSDQLNLLENYVINQAAKQTSEYQASPNRTNFKYLIDQLQELNNMTIEKDNPTDAYLMQVMDNILSDKPKEFIKTGIGAIDDLIIGFEPGQINVLGARPSMGKTALVLNVLWNITKEGYPTTFFSLETGGDNIVERLVSSMTNIPLHKIKRGDGMSDDDTTLVMHAIDQIKKHDNLKIEDKAVVTPQDIRQVAMQHTDKPHVIFIDYLTLMQSDTPQKDRRLEVEKISRDLKIIAKETGCVIIPLSQLSRGIEGRQDKRPMMSDLREAGGIEQDANMIFFLYREDYYDKEIADNESGKSEVEFIIAKNKDGETGTANLQFYKKTQRFYG